MKARCGLWGWLRENELRKFPQGLKPELFISMMTRLKSRPSRADSWSTSALKPN